MQRVPMTPKGHTDMQATLKHLKEVVRPAVVKEIEVARAHGDLSENSEYEDAKERQALTEAKIRDLEAKMSMAEVIDVKTIPPSDRIIFGATMVLEDLETEDEITYTIVGEDEAEVRKGLVSVTSPIARAAIGKEIGDEVSFQTPKGIRRLYIADVQYR